MHDPQRQHKCGDRERQELLGRRGYEKTAGGEHLRRWCGACPPEGAPLPAGYRLHAVRPGHAEDCERYAALINAAFRRTCHTAQEVATFTMLSPSFSPELELVAVAPDGSFAALTGMIYDTGNRFGLFEPVCATPAPAAPLASHNPTAAPPRQCARQPGCAL